MAIVAPSGNVALYTRPKPPQPMMLA
uniref:Uncharacterized protein n=1 Tax=Arundo donax TaxID=35708 RepID=A0A0A8YAF7_ARUDO